jgi:transcriptional regulator with XRE-family HTH domain
MSPRSSPHPLAIAIGARLRQIRLRNNLCLSDLAKHGGPNKGWVSSIENGKTVMTVVSATKLAERLDVDLLYLLAYSRKSDLARLVRRAARLTPKQLKTLIKEWDTVLMWLGHSTHDAQ